MNNEILIGRTDAGEKVYVSARLERQAGEWQTVTHETVSSPLEVAFQGTVVRKGGSITRDGDIITSGQIDRAYLRRVGGLLATGWSVEDVRKLADLWDEWHLNAMQAGCAHQTPVYEDGRYGRRVDLDNTPACPVTGYKYGSAWLTRPLPDEVAAWVSERFSISVPAEV